VAEDDEAKTSEREVSVVKRVRYVLEGAILNAFGWLVRALPFRAMYAMADVIGVLTYHALRPDRRVALANLDIAFGDSKTPAEKRRIAKASFRNLSRTLVSLFWAPNLTPENFCRYGEVEPESDRHMKSLAAAGKGVILCSPHFGNWELGSVLIGFFGPQMLIVGEPTRNPAVGEKIFQLRGVSGHKVVPPQFAVLKLFRQVMRGGVTTLLVDVNGRRKRGGVWCDYFGLSVFNSSAAAELALRTGAAIVIGIGRPLSDGRVRMHYWPLEVTPTNDRAADIQRVTQAITKVVENLVRAEPELWLWTYKRWKRRPSADVGRYPFYSKFQQVQ
jgi:Kdo2-lipid IVA lauroyltransferase/acyltransferase